MTYSSLDPQANRPAVTIISNRRKASKKFPERQRLSYPDTGPGRSVQRSGKVGRKTPAVPAREKRRMRYATGPQSP